MRKLIVILISLVTCFVFVGCGGSGNTGGSSPEITLDNKVTHFQDGKYVSTVDEIIADAETYLGYNTGYDIDITADQADYIYIDWIAGDSSLYNTQMHFMKYDDYSWEWNEITDRSEIPDRIDIMFFTSDNIESDDFSSFSNLAGELAAQTLWFLDPDDIQQNDPELIEQIQNDNVDMKYSALSTGDIQASHLSVDPFEVIPGLGPRGSSEIMIGYMVSSPEANDWPVN